MRVLLQVLRFAGQLARPAFAIFFAAVALAHLLTAHALLAALPVLAGLFNPLGINAGLALNASWLATGLLAGWLLVAAMAARLRDAGRSPGLSLVAAPGIALLGVWMTPLLGPELARRTLAHFGDAGSWLATFFLALSALVLVRCLAWPTRSTAA